MQQPQELGYSTSRWRRAQDTDSGRGELRFATSSWEWFSASESVCCHASTVPRPPHDWEVQGHASEHASIELYFVFVWPKTLAWGQLSRGSSQIRKRAQRLWVKHMEALLAR